MSFLSAPKINYSPPGFSGGGINATFSGNKYNLGVSPERSNAVGNVASTFGQAASAFGALGQQVKPGFSLFRQAGLSDLSNQQHSAQSNLSENMAKRRVLGSSFASDAASRQDAEFAKQRDDFIAQSYLQELEASNKLTQQQFEASVQQFQTGITEMNFEAGIAADLTGKASAAMAGIATAQAQLDAQNAAGIGKMLGTVAAIGAAPFTGGASLFALPGIGALK